MCKQEYIYIYKYILYMIHVSNHLKAKLPTNPGKSGDPPTKQAQVSVKFMFINHKVPLQGQEACRRKKRSPVENIPT